MDFGRNSQYRQQSQNARVGQKRREEAPQDDYIRLSNTEIAGCISDIGVPFSSEDLQRPQPQQIQRIFECFAELLLNTTRDTVEPAMREAARVTLGEEHMEVVPLETRNLMGFYASLRGLLADCGVKDFCFTDLVRPTHPRLVKIFSYLINFVRFREQQTDTIDKHFNALNSTKQRIESLHTSNANLQSRLDEILGQKRGLAEAHDTAQTRNEKLKNKLRRLQREQEERQLNVESAKAERDALVKNLQEMTARNVTLRQECDKLRPYSVASGSGLQTQLDELQTALKRDKTQLAGAEKRLRALHTSADAFGSAVGDVAPCVELLNSLQGDLEAEETEATDAAKRRDALTDRSLNARRVERDEDNLKGQLKRWNERTEDLRKQADKRSGAAGERMIELGAEHRRLMAERGEKGREVERRKVRVEQTEKKMADMKENVEAEVNAAREEYVKLDAHIRLYISEMEQSI